MPLEEVRGFALADRPLPVIVVNGQDRPNGRTFTLVHELGHVLPGETATANELELETWLPDAARPIEVFCNRFAAAALIPRDALLAEPVFAAKPGKPAAWSDEEIGALAIPYAVSREALLLRSVDLEQADQAFYQSKRAQYQQQYAAEGKPANEGGFAPYRHQVLKHLGRGFARLILQGYYQKRLSLSAVAGYLGVQVKHVPDLERAAFARAS